MKRRKQKLAILEESARVATRSMISEFPHYFNIPTEHLTLGTFWENDDVIFELYIAGDRPKDAIVLTTTRVDLYSGEVLSVKVHEEAWERIAQLQLQADAPSALGLR